MKTKNFIFLLGIMFSTDLFSQTVSVDNTYGFVSGRIEYPLIQNNETYQSESIYQTQFAPYLAVNNTDFSGRVLDKNVNSDVIGSNFKIKKYNAEGKLELTYGNNGYSVATCDWSIHGNFRNKTLYSNHNGENIVAGLGYPNNLDAYRLGKFSLDGNTFTDLGTASFLVNSTFEVLDIKVLADNSVFMYLGFQDFKFGIIKFNSQGVLDTSFNGSGMKVYTQNRPGDYTSSVITDSNNNFYFTTSNYNKDERIHDIFVRKINSDGSIDTSFGTNGISMQAPEPNKGFTPKSIGITQDNKILVLVKAYAPARNLLMRLNSNGSLDTSFGQNGYKTLTGIEYFNSRSMKIINNKIYLVGDNNKNGTSNYTPMIAKLDINGNLDTSLNGTGILTQTIYNNYDANLKDIILQPTTNKLLVFGETNTPSGKLTKFVFRLIDQEFLGTDDKVNKKEFLNIYPNPAKDVINFNENTLVKANEVYNIYDLTGKEVLKGKVNESMKINVSYLPKGVYILKIKEQSIKFIKD
ncbi:delta-60 repeat domain-containing protein/Por secretion system C-terminal sorting domain-containing protein [Chryseobacterium oleae]|uniref:Delta-60 repeat domain-containing protein/Por secretion system C-terminal sorting domain-containing protein n=1 Tax=Chryseobacterium oleae TaxID=491207 RepID=A0A1I4WE19_CHROL|nr:T9SS type A sorting domain-containing protein [Chryseobacterium oleae]SFN12011.1 delta-60 repeat domain-containing protein/Por secretion system C-terminal sorting domain-containing protein [Chryseobacterium oleae]